MISKVGNFISDYRRYIVSRRNSIITGERFYLEASIKKKIVIVLNHQD